MINLPLPHSSVVGADPYDNLSPQVKEQLEVLDALGPEEKQAIVRNVHQEFARPETAEQVLKGVEALGNSIIEISVLFEKVRLRLADVDGHRYKVGSKSIALPKLEPEWKLCQEKLKNILKASRETASETVAYIGHFQQYVLPKVKNIRDEAGLKAAQEKLENFAEKENPAEKRAGMHSQDFIDLHNDLEAFRKKFDDHTKPVQEALGAEITGRNAEIAKLSDEIAECDAAILYTAVTLGVIGLATGVAVGVGLAFSLLAPEAIIGILTAGIAAAIPKIDTLVGQMRKLDVLKAEQSRLKGEVEDLASQLKEVQRVQTSLNNQKDTIVSITARIDQLANIWSGVAFEATKIGKELEKAYENGRTTEEFKERLATLETNYTTLKDALYKYSIKTKVSSA